MELSVLQTVLRTIASAARIPVIVILIGFIAFSLFSIGWLIVEAFRERLHLKYHLPKLLDAMKEDSDNLSDVIIGSGLLVRQKQALLELTRHPGFSVNMLESLADDLIEDEQAHYDRMLSVTNLVSKLAPMAGLLGTLIPLGPGIIALGQGDTLTLSESMLTAFDTTIAGLIAAGVCLVISTIRRRWYKKYMYDLETLVDCVVDLECEHSSQNQYSGGKR